MLGSVLSFSPDLADRVSEYCEKHSEALPEALYKHWEWTIHHRFDSDMMSSKLQGQWMIWMAQWIAPKRGLEQARKLFKELAVDDRITTIEGPALWMLVDISPRLKTLKGEFDLILFDADKMNQQMYLDIILEQRLLSPRGIIFVDNIFARGMTIGKEFNPYIDPQRRPFFERTGEALRKTSKAFIEDPRVDAMLLPLFDGITQIKWKEGYLDKIGN